MTLTITAAICSRNRAEWVRRSLGSLLAQDLPADRLDIVVVDNGSTDHTAEVVRALAAEHDHVRYELEARPGLSRARNRAIEVAEGDVVAFLDDDAVAVPGWARTHLEAFEADDAVAGTGGPIALVWPGQRPVWLPDDRDGMYAGLDLGDQRHELEPPAIPYGANMAFRRRALDGPDTFVLSLGRQGGSLLSGEERVLFEQLRARGGRLVYLPEAKVDHHVLPDRTSREWLLRRCYHQGRSTVAMDVHRRGRRPRTYWAARALWRAGDALRFGGVAVTRAAARRSAKERTWAVAMAAQAIGTAHESVRMARRPG